MPAFSELWVLVALLTAGQDVKSLTRTRLLTAEVNVSTEFCLICAFFHLTENWEGLSGPIDPMLLVASCTWLPILF